MWNWNSFDIDLPTECDDEYWTNPDPEQAFKQPPGKPSKVAFFNCFVRLHQILAFAMRTIVRFLSFVFFFLRLCSPSLRLLPSLGRARCVGVARADIVWDAARSTQSTSRRRSSASSANSGSNT